MKFVYLSGIAAALVLGTAFGSHGAAEAQSYNRGHVGHVRHFGSYPLTGDRAPIVVRQSVVVERGPSEPFLGYGGVVAATGIRAAPIGAPALYIIQPTDGRRGRRASLRDRRADAGQAMGQPRGGGGFDDLAPRILMLQVPRG